jgi:hypothetical protein
VSNETATSEALARFVGAVPDPDHPIELLNLLLEGEQLIAERGKACAGNLRHSFIARVGNNMQQFRDPFAAALVTASQSASATVDRPGRRQFIWEGLFGSRGEGARRTRKEKAPPQGGELVRVSGPPALA